MFYQFEITVLAIVPKHSLMWISLTHLPISAQPIYAWGLVHLLNCYYMVQRMLNRGIIHSILQGNQAPSKKNIQEIPTPQFDIVDTYERDYTRTFAQPTSYIRGRGGFFLIVSLNLAFSLWALLLIVIDICS